MNEKTYLFEYWCDGNCYGLTVVASNFDEASRRVQRMSSACYKGEVALTVPVDVPSAFRVMAKFFGLPHR